MTKITRFPNFAAAQRRASAETRIPFSREQLMEIAAHLNAASPAIHDEIEQNGGSRVTSDFLDWLWKKSRGRQPQARRGAITSTLALALSLASALPGWAGPSETMSASPAAAFDAAAAHLQQLWRDSARDQSRDPQSWSPAAINVVRFALIAYEEKNAHPVEVDHAVEQWKPNLHAAWWACELHRVVGGSAEEFKPLFSSACPVIEARYNQAEKAVGYVLAQREAAADLTTIAKAAAPPK